MTSWTTAHPLEPSAADMRARAAATLDRVIATIESLPRQPMTYLSSGAETARSLVEQMPERGTPYEELLSTLFDRAAPVSFNTASPGYLAYIPGGGLFDSAMADLIGDTLNRYVGVWAAAPALAQIEANVVHWLAEIVGYPASAAGFLTSGGSLANFSAVVTARVAKLGEQFLSGTIYTSAHAHHSVQKAAMLAGLPARSVREVPSDDQYRIRPDAAARMISDDRAAGLQPFLIVGNAGTTNTGAVDDLMALADLAAREDLWLHTDGAYGGFFMLTERGRRVMRGIERSDSVTLDPHKGMFLPYGTGSLLVRDRAALEHAHGLHADYLPSVPGDEDMLDFSTISPELTRPFRGIRVWLPLKLHGVDAIRSSLDEKLDLTAWATEALRAIPDVEIVAEPQLTVVAFRLRPGGVDGDALDQLNRRFIQAVNARQRVHLSGTVLDSGFVLRICVLSFRTHMERMREGLEDLRDAAREVRAS